MNSQTAFAYVCAPFEQGNGHSLARLREYSIQIYQLGFIPMCPNLYFSSLIDNDARQEMRNDLQTMALAVLKRCRLVIVCSSDTITPAMERELLFAGKHNMVVTTLQGMQRVSKYTRRRFHE